MTAAIKVPSVDVENCPPESIGQQVSRARSANVIMTTSAEVMRQHSAPAGWNDEHGTTATHLMTRTAQGLEADTAALDVGIGALDVFCTTIDSLRTERRALITRRDGLVNAASSSSLTGDDEIRAHNRRVDEHDAEARAWNRRLHAAESTLIAALRSADSVAEARAIAGRATDPADLKRQLDAARSRGPAAVAAWWRGLGPADREALLAAMPEVVGRTDGLPAVARNQANRLVLGEDLRVLRAKEDEGALTRPEQERLERAQAVERALERADRYLDPRTGELAGAQLYIYDPNRFDGEGAVAISIGNLDTAEHVATRVPGFGNDIKSAPNLTSDATALYESARTAGRGSVASMFWLDYDAPDHVDTLTEGKADRGGERLADAIDGLRASRPTKAHLTVIGHSYGSTTLGHAMTDHDPDVDDLVAAGSPGMGGNADRAKDLGLDEGHVYVARNSRDPIAMTGGQGGVHLGNVGGGLGNDPSEDDFGATRIRAEATDRASYVSFGDHSKYFDLNSESLANLGLIVSGRGEDVTKAEHTYDPWWNEPQDPERDREPRQAETGDRLRYRS